MSKAQIGDVVRVWPNAHPEHDGGPFGPPQIEGVVVFRAVKPPSFLVVANEKGHWQPLNDENYADKYTQCVGRDEKRVKVVLSLSVVQAAIRHLL